MSQPNFYNGTKNEVYELVSKRFIKDFNNFSFLGGSSSFFNFYVYIKSKHYSSGPTQYNITIDDVNHEHYDKFLYLKQYIEDRGYDATGLIILGISNILGRDNFTIYMDMFDYKQVTIFNNIYYDGMYRLISKYYKDAVTVREGSNLYEKGGFWYNNKRYFWAVIKEYEWQYIDTTNGLLDTDTVYDIALFTNDVTPFIPSLSTCCIAECFGITE